VPTPDTLKGLLRTRSGVDKYFYNKNNFFDINTYLPFSYLDNCVIFLFFLRISKTYGWLIDEKSNENQVELCYPT